MEPAKIDAPVSGVKSAVELEEFPKNLRKLFDSCEQIYQAKQQLDGIEKTKQAGQGKIGEKRAERVSPVILAFINYRNAFTLDPTNEVFRKHFQDIYTKHETVILTGSDAWLKSMDDKERIILWFNEPDKTKDKPDRGHRATKDKAKAGSGLYLSNFYMVADNLEPAIGNPIKDDFLLCIYRIFYVFLIPNAEVLKGTGETEEQKLARTRRETLLHLCRARTKSKASTTPKMPGGSGNVFDMVGKLINRADMQKAIASGNIGAMVGVTANGLNDMAESVGIKSKVEGSILDDVVKGGENFKEALENPGGQEDVFGLLTKSFGPVVQKHLGGMKPPATNEKQSSAEPTENPANPDPAPKEKSEVQKAV
jgi:hypothetical protein